MPKSIAESGHVYAQIFSSAGLSASSTLREMWSGITGMRVMRDLHNQSKIEEKNQEKLIKEQQKIKKKEEKPKKPEKQEIVTKSSKKSSKKFKINKNSKKGGAKTIESHNIESDSLTTRLTKAYFETLVLSPDSSFTASITCCQNDKSHMNSRDTKLLSDLPYSTNPPLYSKQRKNDQIEAKKSEFLLHPRVHLKIDSSTFFCGVSVPSHSYNSPLSASFQVAARLSQAEYLFGIIREKLGAYGAMSSYNGFSGTTSFLSYRDTSPLLVLSAIDNIIDFLADSKNSKSDQKDDSISSLPPVDDEMVDRAIVQVFSSFDSPVAPKNAGDQMFLTGIDDNDLQKRRSALLKVTKKDVIEGFKEIANKKKDKMMRQAIVGGKIDKSLIPDFYVVDVFDLDEK